MTRLGSTVDRACRRLVLASLTRLSDGFLELVCPDTTYAFGDPASTLRARVLVHDERAFRRLLWGGDLGFGEAYVDGQWSSPDLVALVRLATRNAALVEDRHRWLSVGQSLIEHARHRRRANTIEGSRSNIRHHYDLGNGFYRLFLDPTLAYSCGYYVAEGDTLETAQVQKYDRICRKLRLGPADHILEIGTGWGGFALYAAAHHGCRVTTTTISREQHDYARELFARSGPAGARITLLSEDYRHLTGRYDRIVSIEMFEAVGRANYDAYFGACDRLLGPGGTMLLQTITVLEQRARRYYGSSDWIRKHIFPGGELASVKGILESLARVTGMSLFHAEDIGRHYARTLAAWRARFRGRLDEVRALGFDEVFIRTWDYYLAACEGMFLERQIGDVQLLLTKNFNRQPLLGEPWGDPDAASRSEHRAAADPGW